MTELQKKLPIRVLVLISSPKLAEKANRLFEKGRLQLRHQLRGQGTASSEMMDMLGLGSTTKVVSMSILPKPYADRMVALLEEELGLGRPDTGIAFTTAVTGMSSLAMKLMDENIRREVRDTMEKDVKQMAEHSTSSLIVASVNQGFSEEVMEAARGAGARGGTVLHARQMGNEEAMRFWGITIQEEREMVLVLAKAETKLGIMKAIGERCGMQSEAKGFVFSTPIDVIAGFSQEEG